MSGTLMIISAPGYPGWFKACKTIRTENQYLKAANTFHPNPLRIERAIKVSDVHTAKRMVKKHMTDLSKTSKDWTNKRINDEKLESICQSVNNLNVCTDCKGGHDLLCCDGCRRSFHLSCIGLRAVPDGEWNCGMCEQQISHELLKLSNEFHTLNTDDTDWS
jgi:hypothetical protein